MMAPALIAALAACVTVEGGRIRAGDLAPAIAAFATIAAETELGYTPAPGTRRVFRAAELRRLMQRVGAEAGDGRAICVERAAAPLNAEAIAAAMRATAGDLRVGIQVLDWSRHPVPRGEIRFPRNGLTAAGLGPALWRGWVEYDAGRKFVIWARVRLTLRVPRLFAIRALAAGHPVQADDLKVSEAECFPFAVRPLERAEDAVGRIPVRSIPEGGAIFAANLAAPIEIHTGDTVTVTVASGRAKLWLEARAETEGRHGETIRLWNPASARIFRARVEGPGQATAIAAMTRVGGQE